MDFSHTLEEMLNAARAAAGEHWKEIHAYLEKEFLTAKQEAEWLALEVAHGSKSHAQAEIEAQQILESLHDIQSAVHAGLLAAAQAAINAAIDVLSATANKAVGFALF